MADTTIGSFSPLTVPSFSDVFPIVHLGNDYKIAYQNVFPGIFNVQAYGAVGNGITDDTLAIQTAYNAAAINGGILYFPPLSYAVNALTFNSQKVSIYARGATLVGNTNASIILTFTITNALSRIPVVWDGLNINANFLSNIGVLLIDSEFLVIKNSYIANCVTYGVLYQNTNTNGYNELHSIQDSFIAGCNVGIGYAVISGASESFDSTSLKNVTISCNTGIDIGQNASMQRVNWENVTIFVGDNMQGITIEGDITGMKAQIGFENYGTPTDSYGLILNNTRVDDYYYDFEMHFVNSFTTEVVDNLGDGFSWRDGLQFFSLDTTAGHDPAIGIQVLGDSYPRMVFQGNTMYLGPGTVNPTSAGAALKALGTNGVAFPSNVSLSGTAGSIGFFGSAPIAQPTASGNVSIGTAGTTNTVFRNTTFTGGIGTTAYTPGDIVAALKSLGAIKA